MAIDIYSGPTASSAGAVYGGGRLDWYYQSINWTAPSGVSSVKVRVWGAGGGGAYSIDNQSAATGGGGGGYAEKILLVTPGSSYAVTVGIGGQGGWYDGQNSGTQFTAQSGSSSSFAALVSASGGGGGINTTQTSNYGAGAGGSGSSGDINFTGGNGGAFTNNQKASGWMATGGGSAAGPWGPGFRGGNIFAASSSSNIATGGGGVGGQGGDVVCAPQSYSSMYTGGGGSAGPAEVITRMSTTWGRPGIGLTVTNDRPFGYANIGSPSTSNTANEIGGFFQPNGSAGILNYKSRFPGDYLDGSGGGSAQMAYPNTQNAYGASYYGRGGGNGGPGAGGGALRGGDNNQGYFHTSGGSGGIFGGGGGCLASTSNTGDHRGYGGNGGIAGGGGACCTYNGYFSRGGNGGNGLVVIEY